MEHKKEESKVCESECKKECRKQTASLSGVKKCCFKKIHKKLTFIMLVIITISVVSIACMMHRHHKTMDNHNYGMQIPMHNPYR